MADQLQLRGGTTAQNNAFTGAQREVTVDTDLNTLVVHDGITAGGFPVASRSQVNNGTFYFNDNTGGGSAANAYILAAKSNTNRPTQYLDGIQLGFVTANANTGPSTANFSGLGVKSIKYAGGADPAAGDLFGRVYLIYDAASDWFELQRKAVAPPPQLRAISASVNANALTATMVPSLVSFRSPTLSNGAVNDRTVTATLSITAPSGATFGTTSGVLSRLVLLAVDNAGAVSLALVNSITTQSLDETQLINTTAIGAGSTSSNTIYANTNMSGVPFRVLGYIESTQPTAGVWSTSPSQTQPIGGQIILGLPKFVQASPQNTTSGTSIDFTGLPTWVKSITVIGSGVSTNGTSPLLLRLGTSGGIDATSYVGAHLNSAGVAVANTGLSVGILIDNTTAATYSEHFVVHISNLGGNGWVFSGTSSENTSVRNSFFTGSKTLSGVLDRVRLTTTNGTDVFDGGAINIIYQG